MFQITRRACIAALTVALFSPVISAQAAEEEKPSKVIDPASLIAKGAKASFVFKDDRPFKACHASTIVETKSGDLLCAWFGGKSEKSKNVAIWLSRYTKGSWGTPIRVAKLDDTAHWNPVLFRDASDKIHLFFKIGPEISHWQTYWISSSDDGKSWNAPTELVDGDYGGRGPVRNKPITLSDGSWLAGASTEFGPWEPFGDRSEDGGKTWTRSENIKIDKSSIKGKGAIQATLWEYKPNHVRSLLRTTGGIIGRSDSTDGGKTWSTLVSSGLPNNNSGIDAHQLKDGRVLLVYNPNAKNWGSRSPLNLAISHDNGMTWKDIASLESQKLKEFSYPAIVGTEDGVAISYTWKRERIRTWTIPLTALEGL